MKPNPLFARFEAARHKADPVVELSCRALVGRGFAALKAGNYEQAFELADAAHALHPGFAFKLYRKFRKDAKHNAALLKAFERRTKATVTRSRVLISTVTEHQRIRFCKSN